MNSTLNMLGFTAIGPNNSSEKIVLVHGFTQAKEIWQNIAPALAEELTELSPQIISVDLPGHGESGSQQSNLWQTAEKIVEMFGNATYVGYSLGARVALHCALHSPHAVRRLVLCGATPGLRSNDEREARRIADENIAQTIEQSQLHDFLQDWTRQAIFNGYIPSENDMSIRLNNKPSGLATSLRTMGTGTQDDLWGRLPLLSMPVLFVTGQDDEKFSQIAREMQELIGPVTQHSQVLHCSHAVPFQKPTEFISLVSQFVLSH